MFPSHVWVSKHEHKSLRADAAEVWPRAVGDYCSSQTVGWWRVGGFSPTLSTFTLLPPSVREILLGDIGLWKTWLFDAWRSWTRTNRTAARWVRAVGISTFRPLNRTVWGLPIVDPQTRGKFITTRPWLTLEGRCRGTLRRLDHFIQYSFLYW